MLWYVKPLKLFFMTVHATQKLSALHKHIHHPIISHHIIFKTPSPTHFYSKPNRRAVMEYQKLNTAQNLRDCSCIPRSSSVVLTSAPLGIKTHQMNLCGLLLAYTYQQRREHTHTSEHQRLFWLGREMTEMKDERRERAGRLVEGEQWNCIQKRIRIQQIWVTAESACVLFLQERISVRHLKTCSYKSRNVCKALMYLKHLLYGTDLFTSVALWHCSQRTMTIKVWNPNSILWQNKGCLGCDRAMVKVLCEVTVIKLTWSP